MVRSPRIAALVALCLAALVACKKVGDPKPTPTQDPVPAPIELLVEASMPKLAGGLTSLGDYVDKVQPGIGAMMDPQTKKGLARAVGLASLDGAKDDAPVYFLILDPEKGDDGNALLVGVADEAKLRAAAKDATIQIQGGRALVGGKRAVETLAPYAFATLAKKAPPEMAAAVVYVPALLAAYRDDIKAGFEKMKTQLAAVPGGGEKMGRVFDLYLEAVIGLLERSDAIEVRLESTGDLLSLDVAFVPKPGSDLAAFVAVQKPATGGLLARLPAGASPPSLVMVAQTVLGPLRAKLRPVLAELFTTMVGWPLDAESSAALEAWFDELTGEMAMVGDFGGGMRFTQLVGAKSGSDAMANARKLFGRVFGDKPRDVDAMGQKITVSVNQNAGTHEGVGLMSYESKFDLASLPPEVAEMQRKMYGDRMSMLVGGWDDVIGFSIGPDSAKTMPGLIDAARGKAPRLELPTGMARLLEDSRTRGESMAFVMNMTGILAGITGGTAAPSSSGFLMALGFQGGRAHLRFALPAEHANELRTAFSGGM